jgi:hypothetical protein
MTATWNCPLTPVGNIRRPTETLHGQWIKTACKHISPEPIIRGFKKYCVSKGKNGTEDCVLWKNGQEETCFVVRKVLPVTSLLSDVFVAFHYNNTVIF